MCLLSHQLLASSLLTRLLTMGWDEAAHQGLVDGDGKRVVVPCDPFGRACILVTGPARTRPCAGKRMPGSASIPSVTHTRTLRRHHRPPRRRHYLDARANRDRTTGNPESFASGSRDPQATTRDPCCPSGVLIHDDPGHVELPSRRPNLRSISLWSSGPGTSSMVCQCSPPMMNTLEPT